MRKIVNKKLKNANHNNGEYKKFVKALKDNQDLRYFGVILERLEEKVDMTLEAYSMTNTRLDKEFDAFHIRFNSIELILRGHESILREHTKILCAIQKDIEIMKYEMTILKSDLRRKANLDEFEKLERRVVLLESKK
ncbi:MAG: hypothetical protein AAB371_03350 [Patescibacteria group bacterium]